MSYKDTINISCKEISSMKTYNFSVKLDLTICEIKKRLHAKCHPNDQNLSDFNSKLVEFTLQGKILTDDKKLSECDIDDGDVIMVVFTVIGGLWFYILLKSY